MPHSPRCSAVPALVCAALISGACAGQLPLSTPTPADTTTPTALPAEASGVTVLHAGSGPREILALRMEPGAKFRSYLLTHHVTGHAPGDKLLVSASTPSLGILLVQTVHEVPDSGGIELETGFELPPDYTPPAPISYGSGSVSITMCEHQLAHLPKLVVVERLQANGLPITDPPPPQPDLSGYMQAGGQLPCLVASLGGFLTQTPVLPSTPMGLGGHWRHPVSDTLYAESVGLKGTATHRITAVDDARITYETHFELHAADAQPFLDQLMSLLMDEYMTYEAGQWAFHDLEVSARAVTTTDFRAPPTSSLGELSISGELAVSEDKVAEMLAALDKHEDDSSLPFALYPPSPDPVSQLEPLSFRFEGTMRVELRRLPEP